MIRDVLRALIQKPVTETYPAERETTPDTLRGRLHWTPDACTGCALCTKDCPAEAITLITVDKAAKRFVMEYHADRCIYCGQCVQSCRFDCITLAKDEWELAALDRAGYSSFYGNAEDVKTVLAGPASTQIPIPCQDDQPG